MQTVQEVQRVLLVHGAPCTMLSYECTRTDSTLCTLCTFCTFCTFS